MNISKTISFRRVLLKNFPLLIIQGPWRPGAHVIFQNLSERLVEATCDQNAVVYLAQHISIAIQRGNAASMLGTLPFGSGLMYLNYPYTIVGLEVFKALNKTRGLYLRWQELGQAAVPPHTPEAEWTCTELKNALRSIEWDLEDLDDTITSIVEKNSSKFKIDNKEISERKKFIDNTRKEVKMMRGKLTRGGGGGGRAQSPSQSLYSTPPNHRFSDALDEDSTPLISTFYSPRSQSEAYATSPLLSWDGEGGVVSAQSRMVAEQEEQLDCIANSTRNMKHISLQIGQELDEHGVLIEELHADLENTHSQVHSTIGKVARVLRLNSDGRQWCIIGLLIILVIMVLILFIII